MGNFVFSDESKQILSGKVPEEKINYIDEKNIKEQLKRDIYTKFKSQKEFAGKAKIDESHLNLFLNHSKNLSPDKLISACIVLGYNIAETKKIMAAFRCSFSAHVKREKFIMKMMNNHCTLDEIDSALLKDGYSGLYTNPKKK